MPLNGSGGTTQPTGGAFPASGNTLIESGKVSISIADIYTILASALYKDGQQVATQRIPFAQGISVDDIDEKTSGSGVNIDGLLIKDSAIADTNGNEAIKVGTTTSAVNEITVTNAATGNPPAISATGGDTDISINIVSKGAGVVQANGATVVPTLGTEQASTSGTSIDFTGIQSWVKRITIQFVGVSTSGASDPLIQIGDSGGAETSGYLGAGSTITTAVDTTNYTAGFGLAATAAFGATTVAHGQVVLTLEDAAGFTWTMSGSIAHSNAAVFGVSAGSKSLSAALDRVRITTAGGSDTFDAGAINILYE